MEKKCEHHNFFVNAKIGRLTESEKTDEVKSFCADIKINCTDCGQAFAFVGVPGGYSPSFPCVSFDGTELRAPIRPIDKPIEKDPKKTYN